MERPLCDKAYVITLFQTHPPPTLREEPTFLYIVLQLHVINYGMPPNLKLQCMCFAFDEVTFVTRTQFGVTHYMRS